MATLSEARINANRLNALRSTGPKSPEGKAIARRNALTHGLTGRGVVVPGEDASEVDRRMTQLVGQLAGDGLAASTLLAERVAILSVRLERSVRHESAMTSDRIRQADTDFVAGRQAEARRLFDAGPAQRAELLERPEGVELVLEKLGKLRGLAVDGHWTETEGRELARCFGMSDGQAGEESGSNVDRIDDEIARLEAHHATLDLGAVASDRAAAADRVLIGDDPATLRARKYEAATERALFRILKEIRVGQTSEASASTGDISAEMIRNLTATQAEIERLGGAKAQSTLPVATPSLGSFFPEPSMIDIPASPASIRVGNPAPRGQSRYADRKKRPRVPR